MVGTLTLVQAVVTVRVNASAMGWSRTLSCSRDFCRDQPSTAIQSIRRANMSWIVTKGGLDISSGFRIVPETFPLSTL